LLIVGGADHKTGQAPNPQQHYRELEAWLRTHVPTAGALAYRWSGEVMQSLDGMAYLGRNPGSRNVYVVTGDSGTGITHATIGAIMICDLIMGREARWLDLYDPARRPLREALHFIKDQSNVASQYIGWLSQGDEQSAAALAPGEGAVIRSGMRKLAVYRDDEGTLHCHSAKCSHLGCIVQWNAPEHSWDCPCHGSRFSAYGSVLHGPAVRGLAAAELGDVKGEPRSPAGTQAAGRTEADAGGPRP
jgi:nitrite reductase/ring-hydroxylating ferredoxin subunit